MRAAIALLVLAMAAPALGLLAGFASAATDDQNLTGLVYLGAAPTSLRVDGAFSVDKLLARIGLAESVSEAARKRKAGAVSIDGVKQLEPKFLFYAGSIYTIQVGKKWRRVAV